MSHSAPVEKRARKRLLCSDAFGDCTLRFDAQEYTAQSINYNQYGIGLFAMKRLPDLKHALLFFSYESDDTSIKIEGLAAEMVHANETDVGHQYGFKFSMDKVAAEDQARLAELEALLERDAKAYRYELFS